MSRGALEFSTDVLSIHNLLSSLLSMSQFIKGKPGDLQKLLRYLSGLVTSTFTVGTSGCDGSVGRGG